MTATTNGYGFDEGERCPKCANEGRWTHKVEYNASRDLLDVTCGCCGHVWSRPPFDASPCPYSGTGAGWIGLRWCSLKRDHIEPHDFKLEDNPYASTR